MICQSKVFISAVALSLLMLNTASAEVTNKGEALYLEHCAVCHQPDGKGVPGFFPPLAGNPRVLAKEPKEIQEYLTRIIFGYHGGLIVDNKVYSGRMPPLGYTGNINESDLLKLINYQRSAWGNDARPITFKDLATAREKGRDTAE